MKSMFKANRIPLLIIILIISMCAVKGESKNLTKLDVVVFTTTSSFIFLIKYHLDSIFKEGGNFV